MKFVLQAARLFSVAAGDVIYAEKAAADAFYFVKNGTFRATQGETKLRDYAAGDVFGSFELLYPFTPRSASVTCLTGGSLWSIPKRVFDMKLKIAPPVADRRLNEKLHEFCCSTTLFHGLPKEKITQVLRAANAEELKAGEVICEQGDQARDLYAVLKGTASAFNRASDTTFDMKPRECFGESALYAENELRVRQATCRAGDQGATILRWNVSHIESLVGFGLQEESVRNFNRKLLASVRFGSNGGSITAGMSKADVDWLLAEMQELKYSEVEGSKKAMVVAEGEPDERLLIIKRGRASVHSRGTGELCQLKAGDFFGELSLLEPRAEASGEVEKTEKRRPKRTTTVSAIGEEPLIVLSLGITAVRERDELREWRENLTREIRALNARTDSVIVQRVESMGGDTTALFTVSKEPKREKKKKGERLIETGGSSPTTSNTSSPASSRGGSFKAEKKTSAASGSFKKTTTSPAARRPSPRRRRPSDVANAVLAGPGLDVAKPPPPPSHRAEPKKVRRPKPTPKPAAPRPAPGAATMTHLPPWLEASLLKEQREAAEKQGLQGPGEAPPAKALEGLQLP